MAERVEQGSSTDSAVISDAFVAARELLQSAELEATRLRADADRYVRQREQEASLLVAKARRLLAMAERRAGTLGARDAVPQVIDLDAELEAEVGVAGGESRVRVSSGLDGILASAITKAIDRSFPPLR